MNIMHNFDFILITIHGYLEIHHVKSSQVILNLFEHTVIRPPAPWVIRTCSRGIFAMLRMLGVLGIPDMLGMSV